MKVYIGPYKNWIGPYQIAEKILFWMDKHEDDRVHNFGTWLAENKDGSDSWLTKFCQWIDSKKDRKVKIRIDRYDTWSMDHTLAHIILPMLKQLKESKHGSPYVDDEDLPENLRMSKREKKVFEEGYWNKKIKTSEDEQEAANKKFHARWEWIMGEMIFAFESQFNDWEDQFSKGEIDHVTVPIDADGNVVPKEEAKFFRWDHGPNYTYEVDWDGRKAYAERIQNGYRLFGKYYQSLWD